MQGRYPREWVDELFARADIVQVVSSYLPLTKRGQRYWDHAPSTTKRPPLSLSAAT